MLTRQYPGEAGAPVEAPSRLQTQRGIHPQYSIEGGYEQ